MNNISLKRLYLQSALKSSLINFVVLVGVTFISLKLFNIHETKKFAESISLSKAETEQLEQFLLTNNKDALDLFFIEKKSTHNLKEMYLVDGIDPSNCYTNASLTICGNVPLEIYQKLNANSDMYLKMVSHDLKMTHGLYFYIICLAIFIFNIMTSYLSNIFAQKEIKKQLKDIENNNMLISDKYPRISEFEKLGKIITSAQKSILSEAIAKGNIKLIKKIQHDIDSPMTTLEYFMLESRKYLTEELRQIGRQSLNRVQDIINTLKVNEDFGLLEESSSKEIIAIYPFLKKIVSEKRIEYKSQNHVHISVNSHLDKDVFVNIKKSDFNRALSNIINNAVEAKKVNETINISLIVEKNEDKVTISISDDGVGIDKTFINEVFEYGKSFNKNGSGIGLNQAKDYIESENGILEINSTLGQGTTINIGLNEVEAPIWYLDEIKLTSKKFVVVDDDESIHNLWNEKLGTQGLEIIHMYSAEEFEKWAMGIDLIDYHFLFDLELIGSTQTGIDLINTYQLQNRSVLITSHFFDQAVQKLCARFGIKMIPKESVLNIPVVFEKPSAPEEIVLIDDDKFTHLNWRRSAKNIGISLHSYYSVDEFLDVANIFKTEVPIYVDSNLGDGQKGEVLSEKIYKLGFKNIYLATGSRKEDIEVPYWIKQVQGKGFYVQN